MTNRTLAPVTALTLLRALSALALATCVALPAMAQTPTVFEEQGQLIRGSKKIANLGPDLFGDKISLYTGSVEFIQTDINVPGNNALAVSVGRRYSTGAKRIDTGHFGDWDLDIPHIKGVFSRTNGWDVEAANGVAANRYKRCSLISPPAEALTQTRQAVVDAQEFWLGTTLYVPGAGDQPLLQRTPDGMPTPNDGQVYPAVTKAGWVLKCVAAVQGGEGFVAVSPDGTSYRFDWLVSRNHPSYQFSLGRGGGVVASPTKAFRANAEGFRAGTNDVAMGQILERTETFLFPTSVTDRFGNTVTYQYNPANPWQLTRIAASDGREITLNYVAGTRQIQSASYAGRVWTYAYDATGKTLATVTQPDNSRWTFSGASLQLNPTYTPGGAPVTCLQTGYFNANPTVRTMTHPNGARGDFTVSQVLRGRSHVMPSCPTASGVMANFYPVHYLALALTAKTISGPGLSPQTWSYTYGPPNGSVSPCTNCPDTVTLDVQDPRGFTTRYTHSNRWEASEGQLLRIDEGYGSGVAVRSTTHHYRAIGAGPYPLAAGAVFFGRGDAVVASRYAPIDEKVVTQQGTTFTWRATTFDLQARPTTVSQFSSLGHSRTELSTYFDLPTKWVMGQRASTSVAGIESQRTSYDSTTGLPTAKYEFGKLKASYQFHADGTLWRLTDGRGNTSTYTNYKRGLAQNIAYADGASESAVVNDIGLVTSLTSTRGYTTTYGYDAMGRLSLITPPTSDGIARNPTSLVFEPVASAEYGIAAGHWRQTITTGAGKTVNYFDALLRPRVSAAFDNNDVANTQKLTMRSFDVDGRVVFESYPQRSLASVASPPAGTGTTYDALGRAILRLQDSELGLLQTTTSYNSGFTRTVTNPRGQATTTWFQAYDQPSEDLVLRIDAPENLRVVFTRDAFGKATSITRSDVRGGATPTATRSYVYDSNHLLCKTIEPEIGATMESYDAASNVAWRATGLGLTSLACDRDSVPAAKRIAYSYDTRNRLLSTTYGDGSPGITRSYDAAGNLATIGSNGTA